MSKLVEFKRRALTSFTIKEGQAVPEQVEFLCEFLRTRPEIRNILEVGFNGGMSAAALLSTRDHVQLISFDLGRWPYVSLAKQLIDELFPGRHRLILGNSLQTLPAHLAEEAVAQTYDLAFIDGGHGDPVPASDLRHARQLLKPDGWVIMDDYCRKFGGSVIAAWDAAVAAKQFVQVGPVHSSGDRGWVCGQPGTA